MSPDLSSPVMLAKSKSIVRTFVVPFVLLSLLSMLWALASPVFSIPDENAHATKAIAVVRGQLTGEQREEVRHLVVLLPPGFEYSNQMLCFARNAQVSADCGSELGDPGGTDWFGNWIANNNPTYYALVGWPSLIVDGNLAVYAMRFASALTSSALLAWAFFLFVAGRQSRWGPAALMFAASPMIVYLNGSVNPQSLEIAAGILLWISLLALLSSFKDPASWRVSRSVLWVAVVLSSAVVAMTRSIGPLWVAVALVAAIALIGWRPFVDALRQRSTYLPVSLVALFMLASVGWTVGAGTLGGQAQASDAPLVGGTFIQGFITIVRNTEGYLIQATGAYGWLDTTVSPLTYAIYFSAIVLLTALALTASSRKHTLTMLGAIVVAITLPGVIQGASVASTGIIWQGRYALVLYIGILIMASWILSVHAPRVDYLSTRVTAVIAVLLTAFHVISFAVVMWRYVVGFDDIVTKMLSAPEWQPPLGWIALTVGYSVVAAGMAAWAVTTARALRGQQDAL